MNFPPFAYKLAFWQALSFLVAGVLGLLVFFGVLSTSWALAPAALLALFLAVLKWFDIEPQFRVWKAKNVKKSK